MLKVSGAPFVTVHEIVEGSPAVTVEGVANAELTWGAGTTVLPVTVMAGPGQVCIAQAVVDLNVCRVNAVRQPIWNRASTLIVAVGRGPRDLRCGGAVADRQLIASDGTYRSTVLKVSGAPFVTVHVMVDGSPAVTAEGVANAEETTGGRNCPCGRLQEENRSEEQGAQLSPPTERTDERLSHGLSISAHPRAGLSSSTTAVPQAPPPLSPLRQSNASSARAVPSSARPPMPAARPPVPGGSRLGSARLSERGDRSIHKPERLTRQHRVWRVRPAHPPCGDRERSLTQLDAPGVVRDALAGIGHGGEVGGHGGDGGRRRRLRVVDPGTGNAEAGRIRCHRAPG